jgi:hypothetical protein
VIIESSINIDNIDWELLKEGIIIADDSPIIEVRKVYLEILEFSIASRYEINIDTCINNILSLEKQQGSEHWHDLIQLMGRLNLKKNKE